MKVNNEIWGQNYLIDIFQSINQSNVSVWCSHTDKYYMIKFETVNNFVVVWELFSATVCWSHPTWLITDAGAKWLRPENVVSVSLIVTRWDCAASPKTPWKHNTIRTSLSVVMRAVMQLGITRGETSPVKTEKTNDSCYFQVHENFISHSITVTPVAQ